MKIFEEQNYGKIRDIEGETDIEKKAFCECCGNSEEYLAQREVIGANKIVTMCVTCISDINKGTF